MHLGAALGVALGVNVVHGEDLQLGAALGVLLDVNIVPSPPNRSVLPDVDNARNLQAVDTSHKVRGVVFEMSHHQGPIVAAEAAIAVLVAGAGKQHPKLWSDPPIRNNALNNIWRDQAPDPGSIYVRRAAGRHGDIALVAHVLCVCVCVCV